MSKRIVILVLLALGLGKIRAQEVWNLEKCIHYALINNLMSKSYELQEKDAKINAQQSRWNLLPSISASSSGGMNYGRSIDPETNGVVDNEYFRASGSVNANVTLFQGFSRINRIAYSRYKFVSSQWRRIEHEDDLAFSILMSYYDVIYYKGMVEIAREQLEVSSKNLKKTHVQIETGLKAKTDIAEMQSAYEKETLDLIQANNMLENAILTLKKQMNYNIYTRDSLIFEDGEGMPEPVFNIANDSLIKSFTAFSPLLNASEADLKAANKNVAIARGQYLPSISLRASADAGFSETRKDKESGKTMSLSEQINISRSEYIGASISIPIFSKNQIRNDVRKALVSKEIAKVNYEKNKQQVYYEILDNKLEVNALYTEYVQTEKQVEADQLAYTSAQRKYDEGLIDVIQLLTVKNRLAESKSDLFLTQVKWEVKRKTLDFYQGIRFWK